MGRSNKNITRRRLYEAFRAFMSKGDRSKITVSAIIEEAGMNRKTFYNHFSTQDELAAWGFRDDLLRVLKDRYPTVSLMTPVTDPYRFDDLPCYVRIPSGALALDQSGFFDAARQVIIENERYYRALLQSDMAREFLRYLTELLAAFLLEDIDYLLKGRRMPLWAKERIASFYAQGTVHFMADSLVSRTVDKGDQESIPLIDNMVHESMRFLVETYQNEKSVEYFSKERFL